MERIPFDIKYRLEIESGGYKIVPRISYYEPSFIKILDWNSRDNKDGRKIKALFCYYAPNDQIKFDINYYFEDGRTYLHAECSNDLFLISNFDYNKPFIDWDAFRKDAATVIIGQIRSEIDNRINYQLARIRDNYRLTGKAEEEIIVEYKSFSNYLDTLPQEPRKDFEEE